MKVSANDEINAGDMALCCSKCGLARFVVVLFDNRFWLRCARCEHDMTMEAFGG